MDKKKPKNTWLVEGILLSLLFGVGALMSNQHPNRFLDGVYAVIELAVIIRVLYKYIRLLRERKRV